MTITRLDRETINNLRSFITITSIQQCIVELVQNSLDANASLIEVYINPDDLFITVMDNGDGISPDDMNDIGKRYKTSKCHSLADLLNIQTHGFRGEALASIASISLLTITSRHRDYDTTNTTRIYLSNRIYNGLYPSSQLSHGTTVSVQGLFQNFPVRRKMVLKRMNNNNWRHTSNSEIIQSIKSALVNFLLSCRNTDLKLVFKIGPELSFSIPRIPGKDSLAEYYVNIFHQAVAKDFAIDFASIQFTYNDIEVSGFISSKPVNTKLYQNIYLNRRMVTINNFYKSVNALLIPFIHANEEYSKEYPFIMSKKRLCKHPLYVLHVTAPMSSFDICQDPSKSIVQLENEIEIENAISKAIKHFLTENKSSVSRKRNADWHDTIDLRSSPKLRSKYFENSLNILDIKIKRQSLSTATIIAQLSEKFIMLRLESDNKPLLVLVDQHAADERVRVEQLTEQYAYTVLNTLLHKRASLNISSSIEATNISIKLEVSDIDMQLLEQYSEQLQLWGVIYHHVDDLCSRTGSHSLMVSHVPNMALDRCFSDSSLIQRLVLQHVHDLHEGRVPKLISSDNDSSILLETIISCLPRAIVDICNSKACRGAIMFGDKLTKRECKSLIEKLSNCRFPFQCAHGRPSMIPLADLSDTIEPTLNDF
ncbi:hypothetical protein V1511DRAFT_454378 [Dipodascopsis uninucleata]